MAKRFSYFLLLLLFATAISQTNAFNDPDAVMAAYKKADKAYNEAERIALSGNYDEVREEKLNREALERFTYLCNDLPKKGNQFDSLLFHCYYKKGVLTHYFDSTAEAKKNYLLALQLQKRITGLPDSFLFKPYIYLGGILYLENKFDSANTCYREAEKIADKYPVRLSESERLLNTLGALYFEAGNYAQAKNYFTKAINTMSLTGETARTLTTNYKINLAATLTKLEDYEGAGKIYEELLPSNINQNDILHNIGFIRYKTGKAEEALDFFRKVSYNNSSIIRLYNDISQAFIKLNRQDSARYYLQLALAENNKWNNNRKNLQNGITLRYLGELATLDGQLTKALKYYQESIIQFIPDFDNEDPASNPDKFTGIFSYINLFNTLTAKAEVYEKIYNQDDKPASLEAAMKSYRAAFTLAAYVERTYNSDEARLFLGRIKHNIHSRPIDVALKLYALTRKKEYLEEVYMFDQQNKASILSLNVKMQEVYAQARSGNPLFAREAGIKSDITRLSLKAANITDSSQLAKTQSSIRDKEIELDKTRDSINSDPYTQQLLAVGNIPPVTELQRKLDNTTALISYHLSDKELLILLITGSRFEYYISPVSTEFFSEVEALKNALYQADPDKRYNGSAHASRLYQQLITPLQPSLVQIKRLVIIPDDELHYLPFETLEDGNKKYLIQQFAVQYQYSTALLMNKYSQKLTSNVLSMAPFAGSGYRDSAFSLSSLPASGGEVKENNGKTLLDSAATKTGFLQLANHFNIVHLATHAIADNNDPERSFISFYPGNQDSRLYAREIYDMRLDTTSLIILSACETGTGQLIKGEGLMSLSRAFAYAGCPSIITSLWKAEDNTTAFITQRLHYYLGRNETKDKALQLAKLDLLKSPGVEARYKTPNYWAHLVLIGEYEPDHKRSNWPFVATGIVAILLGYYFIKKKSRPGKRPAL